MHESLHRDPRDVVWNMLANPDYALEMDPQPYREFATETDEHQWQDFMSGNWAWNQADKISDDPDTHSSTFVPVILGSDKTTVSVATGQNDYYPLYASIRNVRNNVHRAHRNAVAVIGFLAMPKTTKQHAKTANFHNFRRQLFHSSLSYILKNLKPAMMKPEIARFGDGHYRCVIYGLGPYIANYEEQVLLVCIVKNWCAKCLLYRKSLDDDSLQRSRTHTEALIEECNHLALWDEFGIAAQLVPFTNDFPRTDIHELIAPDLLHQIIKGAFKVLRRMSRADWDDLTVTITTVISRAESPRSASTEEQKLRTFAEANDDSGLQAEGVSSPSEGTDLMSSR
ncbi:uncharacterized protein F5891DRAFT_1190888 [Suillus fuscotomentosus]|uniref:Uncharacterized protein n=1 Tax=Suillus fuscotomentosus TaxID=1912939 RepID=A0AAD4E2J3_9AGAM|nr:uncharacterized protein F5891DRAFT_1190888 [Suillus fuscotomentosus]KAG1898506.1 hypothetical protein F5891DRAFT_1190888 [Suillus fuscotomentosus]